MAAKVRVDIVGSSAGLSAAFVKAQAEVSNFEARMKVLSRSMTQTGSTLTRDLTLPIAGVAVAAGKMAIDFQKQMLLVQTQAGASAGEVKKMSAAVLDLARTSAAQGPEQLAQGLYHLESVGLRGAKAIKTLKVASDAAGMGIADLETVANALGAAVTSGITGAQNYTKAMGTLDATIGAGNMRMEDLAGSLGNVVATAKAVGVTLPELGAAMATLTDRGMNADEAATRLRMTFALMERPSKAAAGHLKDMGISSTQLADAIRQHGLLAALELLQAGMEKLGNKTRATQDLLGAFGGGRSGTAILTLVQSLGSGLSSYEAKLKQIDAQTNNFTEKVTTYHETAAFKIDHAWASIQADLVRAGAAFAPIAVQIAQDVDKVANAFDSLSPAEKKVIIDMAALAAAIGPALFVSGKLIKSFLALSTALKTLGLIGVTRDIETVGTAAGAAETEVSGLRLALLGLGNAAVLAGLAGLGAALYETFKHGHDIQGVNGGGLAGEVNPGSGALGQIVTKGGRYYIETPGFRGGPVLTPISSAQAHAMAGGLNGVTSTGSGSVEANSSPGRSMGGKTITEAQIASLWVQAGGDPKMAWIMADVAYKGESGGRVSATNTNTNGTVDRGIFQINSSHGYDPQRLLTDPLYNARAAVSIFKSQGLQAWTDPVARAFIARGMAAGPTSTFNAPSALGVVGTGTGTTTHKTAIISGANLLPVPLRGALDKAAQEVSTTQGVVASKWLHRELGDLKTARDTLEKRLGGATGKQKAAIQSEIHSVNSQIDSVNRQITSNLRAQASAIKSNYGSLASNARSGISSAFSQIKADLDSQFQQATQDYIDNTLGPQYFQGGLQTTAEQAYAAFQDQRQKAGLDKALADAIASGDPEAIKQANLDEQDYQLAKDAAASRAKADKDYAAAVKQYQADRSLAEKRMNTGLDVISKGLANGTKTLGDLQSVAESFGLSLSSDDGIKGDFDTLSTAVQALAGVLATEAKKLLGVGDKTDAAKINAVVTKLGGTAGSVVLGGGARMMKAADGGFVVKEGLAVIHKGETIVPAGRGSGATYNITFPNYVGDKRELIQVVYDGLLRKQQLRGPLGFK